jgi:bifunctional non-homologous end joining protein LigD
MEQTSLRFKQGSSDKVYNAAIIAVRQQSTDSELYVVNFSYGRYGKPLKTGTKTSAAVPYEIAKRAYEKLITEKQAKGYTPDASGIPYVGSQTTVERTKYLPQLLNPIEREDIPGVFERFHNDVALQTKHDGERLILIYKDGELYGSNRRGLKVDLHPSTQKALERFIEFMGVTDFVLDTEDMGEYVVVFDVLEWQNDDLTEESFGIRAIVLENLSILAKEAGLKDAIIFDIPVYPQTIIGAEQYVQACELAGEEGVVFRAAKAPYRIGKPNSWGPCLKLKFWESATCMVGFVHPTKRSISLMVMGKFAHNHVIPVGVGNCTIPANWSIPNEGDMVEIKYLYAYRGGSLYQPQYKGIRVDKVEPDTIESLKYKSE